MFYDISIGTSHDVTCRGPPVQMYPYLIYKRVSAIPLPILSQIRPRKFRKIFKVFHFKEKYSGEPGGTRPDPHPGQCLTY